MKSSKMHLSIVWIFLFLPQIAWSGAAYDSVEELDQAIHKAEQAAVLSSSCMPDITKCDDLREQYVKTMFQLYFDLEASDVMTKIQRQKIINMPSLAVDGAGNIIGTHTGAVLVSHHKVGGFYGAPPPLTMDLEGTHVIFYWEFLGSAFQYKLQIGSQVGGNDLYDSDLLDGYYSVLNGYYAIVENLPDDGRKLYIRVSTKVNNNWITNDIIHNAYGSNPVATTSTTGVTLEKKSNAIFDVIEKDYAQYFFPATATQVSGSGNEIRYSRIYNNEYQAALTTLLNNLWYGFYGEWHRFGTLDEANEHLCNNQCWAVENKTTNSAADFFQESLKYEKQGLYHKALETIEKAIIIEPNNDTYLAYACHYARYTGDYEKGAEYGVKAIMINNNIGWYHVAVSWIAYIAGAMDIAKKYADSALKFGKDALGKANYDAMLIVINA